MNEPATPSDGLAPDRKWVELMAERSRTFVLGTIVGAIVLLVAVVAIIVAAISRGGTADADKSSTPTPASTSSTAPSASGAPTEPANDGGVDAAARGWVAEPITSDPAKYVQAALEAVVTFDTRLATRDEFLAYLHTWMTPALSEETSEDNRSVLKHDVVLSDDEWTRLTELQGTSTPVLVGEVSPLESPDDGSYSIARATMDVTMRPGDPNNVTDGWMETRTIGVMVQCTESTVPTPDTAQKAGDCKVLRWSVNE